MISKSNNYSSGKAASLFSSSNWLHSCSDSVVVIQNDSKENIFYHSSNKWLQKAIIPSVLTPYQSSVNESETLIKTLAKFDFVELYLKEYSEKDILLFKNNKFEISYKYTRILDVNNAELIYQNFKPSLKRQIKKASEILIIEETESVSNLWLIVKQVFQRQQKPVPFSDEQLTAIVTACQRMNCCKMYIARNKEQEICAALLIVWDNDCCYYLTGGIATEFKNTGAMSLLLYKAIEFAATKCKEFDFCGSTIASIDTFFSTFGAIKKDVLVINKYSNPLQKWAIRHWKK